MNDSTVRTLDFVRAIDAGALSDGRFTGSMCSGTQRYARAAGGGGAVRLDIACIRIASSDTDMLLMVNTPVSREADGGWVGASIAGENVLLERMVRSFRVIDFGLFG